jgi:hypothetical protein
MLLIMYAYMHYPYYILSETRLIFLFFLSSFFVFYLFLFLFIFLSILYYLPSVRISTWPKTPFPAILPIYGLWLLTEGGGQLDG